MVAPLCLRAVVIALCGCSLAAATPCPNRTLGPGCGWPCRCLDSGQCDSDTRDCGPQGCLPGYMGPACLQENGVYNLTSDLASDGNASTCVSVESTWTVSLRTSSRITWIRLRTNSTGWSVGLTQGGAQVSCGAGLVWLRDGDLWEWHCPAGPSANSLQLTPDPRGPAFLCEVELFTPVLTNVAEGKPADQSVGPGQASGALTAALAVDGNNTHSFASGSCILTPVLYTLDCLGGLRDPWWAVDLQGVFDVHRVLVYNRDSQFFSNFLQMFRLWFLGDSGLVQVYQDQTPVFENMALLVDVPLPDVRAASGLRVTKDGCTSLQFCEVEVYATPSCPGGLYGVGCNQTCACRNVTEPCHRQSGACLSGCPDGKTAIDCSRECSNGSYGAACQQVCTCRNESEVCDKVTGRCLTGCPDGRLGADCKQECREGWYGRDCLLECAANCSSCDPANGTCYDVCSAGLTGFRCSQTCPGGTYGVGCRYNCTSNCRTECSPVDGSCLDGCQPGWLGNMCNTTCPNGTFGEECQSNCSATCSNFCSPFDGICNGGCIPGWSTSRCDVACPGGQFGAGCASNCSSFHCNGTCTAVDGRCPGNCQAGWLGAWCNVSCPNGTYGQDCAFNCSSHCINSCNHMTGYCNMGCQEGFTGLRCDSENVDTRNSTTVSPVDTDGLLASFSGVFTWILIGSAVAMVFVVVLAVIIVVLRDKRDKRRIDALVEAERDRDVRSAREYARAVQETRKAEKEEDRTHKFVHIRKIPPKHDVIRSNYRHVDVEGTPKLGNLAVEEARRESVALCYGGLDLDASLTSVLVHNLPAFMRRWQDNNNYFKEEFMNLPLGLNSSGHDDVVLNVQNKKRMNRASQALDWLSERAGRQSRVVLQSVPSLPTSDAIISSYVDGYTKTKAFIASKSPNDVIVNGFVRMLWEFDVQKVVMLNNLMEQDKMVSTAYWPLNGDRMFGKVKVTLMSYTAKDDYTIRTLELSQSGSHRKKHVTQYHYTRWPEDDVPDTPWPLLDFRSEVVAGMDNSSSPVVVHCSDGYGRTGTFLALNNLLDQALMDREIDVYACVYKLRQQRVNMVRTVRQYKFLYEILTAHIESSPSFEADLGEPPTRARPQEFTKAGKALGEASKRASDDYMNLDDTEMAVMAAVAEAHAMPEYCAMGVPMNKEDDSAPATQYATMQNMAHEPQHYVNFKDIDSTKETLT